MVDNFRACLLDITSSVMAVDRKLGSCQELPGYSGNTAATGRQIPISAAGMLDVGELLRPHVAMFDGH